MTKVAILVPSLPTGGGVSAVARFLYRGINRTDGFEADYVSLAVRWDDPASVRLTDPATWAQGVRVQKGTDDGDPFRHVGAFLAEFEFQRYRPRTVLTKILREYDLVQVVAGHPAWAYVTKGLPRPTALQVATLASVERASQNERRRGLASTWHVLMTRLATRMGDWALQEVDTVFLENEWMFDYVRRTAPSTQAVFAPPGVDAETFRPADVPYDEREYILSVGRFADPRKNVQLLFEAYARLKERLGPRTPDLVLAGRTAPPDDAWAVAERHGFADSILFFEDVSLDRLVDLYRKAKLFVLSSDEEGLGLVILEAMSCAVPVVSTDCGGPSTIVEEGETGTLVPTGDPESLFNAMEDLLQDEGRLRAYSTKARERVVSEFSEEATMRRFLREYEALIWN
jgi:glycosyltransferase involved in cell wall biosynthesis